ncbi:YecH family metal-binding protein [Shewanella decolorationis]|uniref:YecH family protein n=2 Tax=Shewanella decolorationis TaxID=256839 RepID=A0A5B8QZH2_9GAMM|nr:YecH family metal-binding protein [Shewanella decolorationis]ESE40416.1 metal-binding protein [Shewanella decolorationis S12]QDZ91447.1 YecH family protein [Shewanella decolorationis]GLR30692.1 metal-binding protein [Shewanella decolorationis]
MSDSIHGHDVMALMVAQENPLLKPEFIALMAQTFGDNARYHTCSAEDLTAEELISLLLSKGKMLESEQGLTLVAGRQCNHSHH